MPYVGRDEGLSSPFVELETLARELGEPPWRVALVGGPALRTVVVRWPAGYASVPHRHPRGVEIFLVLEGRAGFRLDDGPEREVGPGGFVHAGANVVHAIRVLGDEPLMMVAAVAPNEDAIDETIEVEPGGRRP